MMNIKDLERLEKKQEKIVEKKKELTEKAIEEGDLQGIEKAQAEEDKEIAVLERIREDKRRAETEKHLRNYVEHMQPVEIEEIAKALNIAPETIEKHIEALGMVKDEGGKIFSDRSTMVFIKSAVWKKKREVATKRWNEIAYINPGLTQQELKETYIKHYPEDGDIERYLEERDRLKDISSTAKIIRYEKRYKGDNCLLCILLCIGILPGVLYYLLARDTIPIYEENKEQNV